MSASDIPLLTEAEKDDLSDRLQETVVRFKRLRASVWSIETFRVIDVVGGLTNRQARWLIAYMGFVTEQRREADVLNLPIELPSDLSAAGGEVYIINWASRTFEPDARVLSEPFASDLISMALKFAKQKRPSRRAA